jgi:hypothetical protein
MPDVNKMPNEYSLKHFCQQTAQWIFIKTFLETAKNKQQ